jgi:hypothetical protein
VFSGVWDLGFERVGLGLVVKGSAAVSASGGRSNRLPEKGSAGLFLVAELLRLLRR